MTPKNEIEIVRKPSPAAKTALVGALVGASAGVIAAMLLQRRAKKQQRETMLDASDAIKIGLLGFGLFRAIASLGDDD